MTDDASTTSTLDDHPMTGSRTVRKPRRKTVLLTVVVMLAIAVPAVAQTGGFRDVGGEYVHAKAVDQMRSAGITVGCGDGTRYCPTDPVTRGAMASFLTRSGAQGYGANNATTLAAGTGNVNGVPVTLDVTGAGESGGRQQVVLQGSVTVTANASGATVCPCEVEAYIYRARGSVVGPRSFATLAGPGSSVSLPVDWATRIDSARTEQYRIAVFVNGTTATAGLRADGALNAVTAPFGRSSSG